MTNAVTRRLISTCLLCCGIRVVAAPLDQPVDPHVSGGVEHIVIIDRDHPTPPYVEDVLDRLALNTSHPDVRMVYNNSAFRGFSASMQTHCLALLANMSDISIVEEVSSISRAGVVERADSQSYQTRPNSPWGLQRISTASKVGGSPSQMNYVYSFANQGLGKGVDIYVVDTGIYTQHDVFDGRAKMIWSFDGNDTDVDGHGTHVSGTAGGSVVGVASNANIFGVKVLDNSGGGSSANVIAGIDYILNAHDLRAKDRNFVGSAMSMSLASGSPVQALNAAVSAAAEAGVHAIVAAGNNDGDACQSSPASSGGLRGPAITVGAVGMNAQRSSFSNYGDCVDVYAPGENVISAWPGAPNMVNSLSGTSMATPHVTGIVAYAMGNKTLGGSPALMKEWVRMQALSVGNGTMLANNGVLADDGEGMLGWETIVAAPAYKITGDPYAGDVPAKS